MARPVIVDLRNIYRADEMKRANFRYLAVGRPAAERYAEARCRGGAKQANAKSAAREAGELVH